MRRGSADPGLPEAGASVAGGKERRRRRWRHGGRRRQVVVGEVRGGGRGGRGGVVVRGAGERVAGDVVLERDAHGLPVVRRTGRRPS